MGKDWGDACDWDRELSAELLFSRKRGGVREVLIKPAPRTAPKERDTVFDGLLMVGNGAIRIGECTPSPLSTMCNGSDEGFVAGSVIISCRCAWIVLPMDGM
jgi:hypothetical protein